MALTTIDPFQARVRLDASHTPVEVRFDGRAVRVIGLAGVRDERAAYPAGRGPRVTYDIRTADGVARLVFDARRHRWFVEAIDRAA